MQLRLPHKFWREDDGKAFYGDDYSSGFQVVTLQSIPRKKTKKDRCIVFTADDTEKYHINLAELKQYWNEKRFEGKLYYTY